MMQGHGVAVKVLTNMGMDLETLRASVERHSHKGSDRKDIENPGYTAQAQEVLSLANSERDHLGHTYLGTEHLLLAILAAKKDAMALVWNDFDIDHEKVRQAILRELDPNFSESQTEEKTNLPSTEANAMQRGNETPQDSTPVSTSKRYDVYCVERGTDMVVYRNAVFKGIKRLLNSSQHDSMGQFIELEQADGHTIFVSRFTVIKFCEPGVTPGGEKFPPPNP
jgi:ATP-dependent Clp protease ATP-binding subunit ClpA